MKKSFGLALLGLGLLLLCTPSLADEPLARDYVEKAGQRDSSIRHLARKFETADGPKPVPLPMPVDPVQANGTAKSVATSTSIAGSGGSIITPRGGAISSPKQQADREIQQLIRRLH